MRCVFSISVRGVVSHAPDYRGTSVILNLSTRPFLRPFVKAAFFMSGNVSHGETRIDIVKMFFCVCTVNFSTKLTNAKELF